MNINFGEVTVVDSSGIKYRVDLIISSEQEEEYDEFLRTQRWDDFPFPKTLDVDGIVVRHIDGNLYKDSKGEAYEFVF